MPRSSRRPGSVGPSFTGGADAPADAVTQPTDAAGAAASGTELYTSTLKPALLAAPSRRLEVITAAVLAAANAVLIVGARAVEVRTETGGLDPRWWPTVIGAIGLTLAVILLIASLVRPPLDRSDLEQPNRAGWRNAVAASVLTGAFVAAWSLVGFVFTAPVFLAAAVWLFGARNWKPIVIFPIAITALIYVLFHVLLKVPL